MTAIPDYQNSITNLIDKHHEEKKELPRPHMGASVRPMALAIVSLGRAA